MYGLFYKQFTQEGGRVILNGGEFNPISWQLLHHMILADLYDLIYLAWGDSVILFFYERSHTVKSGRLNLTLLVGMVWGRVMSPVGDNVVNQSSLLGGEAASSYHPFIIAKLNVYLTELPL